MAAPKKFLLKERRRAARIKGRVPVALVLRRGRLGEMVATPSPGEIIDISPYGAGLSVEQIRVDSAHLFYSPQDNPLFVLHVEVELPAGDEDGTGRLVSIPVRPIRFDRILDEDNDPKLFHVGVEFLLDPTDDDVRLLYRLVEEQNKGKGWLQGVIDSFRSTAQK
ncbi:MAG: PilZ domain-containing protein [Desulfobulbaceae bacterium]|nr:PilZ domain-containing protein [Desulfobulbaceae bacterium]